jgi:hypothetical protein
MQMSCHLERHSTGGCSPRAGEVQKNNQKMYRKKSLFKHKCERIRQASVLFGQLERLLKLFFGLTRTTHSMFLSATFLLEVYSKGCSLILTLPNAVRLTQEERSYIKQGMFVAFD